jgi:hypothetical protein
VHNAELIAHVQSELMSSLFVIQCSVSYVLACSIALLLHKLVLALTAIHKSTVNMVCNGNAQQNECKGATEEQKTTCMLAVTACVTLQRSLLRSLPRRVTAILLVCCSTTTAEFQLFCMSVVPLLLLLAFVHCIVLAHVAPYHSVLALSSLQLYSAIIIALKPLTLTTDLCLCW